MRGPKGSASHGETGRASDACELQPPIYMWHTRTPIRRGRAQGEQERRSGEERQCQRLAGGWQAAAAHTLAAGRRALWHGSPRSGVWVGSPLSLISHVMICDPGCDWRSGNAAGRGGTPSTRLVLGCGWEVNRCLPPEGIFFLSRRRFPYGLQADSAEIRSTVISAVRRREEVAVA